MRTGAVPRLSPVQPPTTGSSLPAPQDTLFRHSLWPSAGKARTMNHRINRPGTPCSSESQNNSIPILTSQIIHMHKYVGHSASIPRSLSPSLSFLLYTLSVQANTPINTHTHTPHLSFTSIAFGLKGFSEYFLYITNYLIYLFIFPPPPKY